MLGVADDAPLRDAAAFALTWANVAAKSKFNGSCCVEDVDDEDALEVCDIEDCSAFFSFNFV
jgi:hypothetical protein